MAWLWKNMKRNTKVLVWDDDGRALPYPEDHLPLYWNPDGGKNYHALENCHGVKDRFLPLTAFTYGELEEAPYDKLTPCAYCTPTMRKADIDMQNQ